MDKTAIAAMCVFDMAIIVPLVAVVRKSPLGRQI
jgi:hypothetical protein